MLSAKLLIILMMLAASEAGIVTYAACQTLCNTAAVARYAAAGLVFGTVIAGPGAPIAAIMSNLEQSSCMKDCAKYY